MRVLGGCTPEREFKTRPYHRYWRRYAFWQAMQHWDPDHVIAFMTNAVVIRGSQHVMAILHTEARPFARWFINGPEAPALERL